MIDPSTVLQVLPAVASVGVASLGVKAGIKGVHYLRDALGVGPLDLARASASAPASVASAEPRTIGANAADLEAQIAAEQAEREAILASGISMTFSTRVEMWREGIGLHDEAGTMDLARRADRFTDGELRLADALQARGMSDAAIVSAIEARNDAMNRAEDARQAAFLERNPDGVGYA